MFKVKQMSKWVLVPALLVFVVVRSTPSEAQFKIKHPTCHLALALGTYYGYGELAYGIGDGTLSRIKGGLEEKGYEIVHQGTIGTYSDEPRWTGYASEQNKLLLILRSVMASVIYGKPQTEYKSCALAASLRQFGGGPSEISSREARTEFYSMWVPEFWLCYGVVGGILDSIPECEKTASP